MFPRSPEGGTAARRDRRRPRAGAAGPRLELAVEACDRVRLRVRLAHRGGATEVTAFDHNFFEVRLAGGAFGAVDPGSFAPYELLADGRRAADRPPSAAPTRCALRRLS